jgi:hypothetical protein
MSAIFEMGRVIREEVELYHGDCLRDGMALANYGKEKAFLWLVRSTGTHIFCLNELEAEGFDEQTAKQLIEMNRRYFLIAAIDSDEEKFAELASVEAYHLLTANNREVETC